MATEQDNAKEKDATVTEQETSTGVFPDTYAKLHTDRIKAMESLISEGQLSKLHGRDAPQSDTAASPLPKGKEKP